MIQAENLHKRFGRVQAVRGVSFTARDGEITGLLGANGAGKTSTLRMLYTLLQPDAGRVRVDGLDAAREPARVKRRLGVLPDQRGLYQRLSARENIRYFGRLQGLDGAPLETRIAELIQLLDLGHCADRPSRGFSQGERVKVALARALVHRPRNLILDEPTNGLDVMTTRNLRQLLGVLRGEGHCIVFSSHVMQEVAALCDRIVVISDGRVVAEGDAETLKASTASDSLEDAFVAAVGGAGEAP